jgi:hypothetical protein
MRLTQVTFASDDHTFDVPAGGLAHLLRIADRLAISQPLAAPTEHERVHHRPATGGTSDPVDPRAPEPRVCRHSGPARNAAATIKSHAVPATRPPTTSVK